jgi:hypothetical protein
MQARIGKLGLAYAPTRPSTRTRAPQHTRLCASMYALAYHRDPLSMLECRSPTALDEEKALKNLNAMKRRQEQEARYQDEMQKRKGICLRNV